MSDDTSHTLFHFELDAKEGIPVSTSLLRRDIVRALSYRKCYVIYHIVKCYTRICWKNS